MRQTPTQRARAKLVEIIQAKYGGNITQAAHDLRVSYWPLYRMLRQKKNPTADFLAQIATALDVTLDSLMAEEVAP